MSVRVLRHPDGVSRGAAFARMASRAHGINVIRALHGAMLNGFSDVCIQARFADNPVQRELKRRQQLRKAGPPIQEPTVFAPRVPEQRKNTTRQLGQARSSTKQNAFAPSQRTDRDATTASGPLQTVPKSEEDSLSAAFRDTLIIKR